VSVWVCSHAHNHTHAVCGYVRVNVGVCVDMLLCGVCVCLL